MTMITKGAIALMDELVAEDYFGILSIDYRGPNFEMTYGDGSESAYGRFHIDVFVGAVRYDERTAGTRHPVITITGKGDTFDQALRDAVSNVRTWRKENPRRKK